MENTPPLENLPPSDASADTSSTDAAWYGTAAPPSPVFAGENLPPFGISPVPPPPPYALPLGALPSQPLLSPPTLPYSAPVASSQPFYPPYPYAASYAPPSQPYPYTTPPYPGPYSMPAGPPLAAPAALPVSASPVSNFGYAVAVAGALLTVFAFFALPYVTATFTTTNQDPTLCGDNACTTTSVTLPAIRSLDGTGVLIVVVILAALTAAIGLFPALRNGVSSLLSPRAAARFVVAAGIAGLVGMLEQYIVVQATILQIAGGADRILQLFGASFSSTVVMQPGFWLMALGTSVIFLGGFIARRGLPPSITPMAPTGSPPIAPPWP